MLQSKDYADMLKKEITPLIEKKKEEDCHKENVIEAYDKLNKIIKTVIEPNDLSLAFKIEKSKKNVFLKTTCEIEVDAFEFGFKQINLKFHQHRLDYHENNLLIHLVPKEESISSKFTGGFNNERRTYSERYILEYVSERK